jgi:hypothetical protein
MYYNTHLVLQNTCCSATGIPIAHYHVPDWGTTSAPGYTWRRDIVYPPSLESRTSQSAQCNPRETVEMHAVQTTDVSKADKHVVSADILGHRTHFTIIIPNYLHSLFNRIGLCIPKCIGWGSCYISEWSPKFSITLYRSFWIWCVSYCGLSWNHLTFRAKQHSPPKLAGEINTMIFIFYPFSTFARKILVSTNIKLDAMKKNKLFLLNI